MRFDYAGHDGAATVRDVEPYRLVSTGRRWYLLGWDTARSDWRTFRADRIRPRVPTGPRFPPREPPGGDAIAHALRGSARRPGGTRQVIWDTVNCDMPTRPASSPCSRATVATTVAASRWSGDTGIAKYIRPTPSTAQESLRSRRAASPVSMRRYHCGKPRKPASRKGSEPTRQSNCAHPSKPSSTRASSPGPSEATRASEHILPRTHE
ncbi:WYL domain-containing protein [Micromonospora sp. ATA32]|nr:WYL domain-containing protein [Micromonospora sp. ATA32]